jgi:tRNA(His) 5'-end guanylyltransferase
MKGYEAVFDGVLVRRSPVIVRVDGKAFHSLTRGMVRPFCARFSACMDAAAIALCEEAQGAKLAYVQSDEISVVLTDYDTLQTEGWFGYRVQKIASVAASLASVAFGEAYRVQFGAHGRALFDARVFVVPRDEVTNYLVWRQRDAVRNSILSTGQAHFSAKQMHKKNTDQVQEMLFQEKGINWNDTPTHFKRGRAIVREEYEQAGAARHRWIVDY